MFDRILDQRLQQHARDHHIERCGLEFFDNPQLVTAESHDFDVEIIIDKLEFIAERRKGFAGVQQTAQNGGELEDHVPRGIRIEADQRRNGIQCVKEEVRIDLVLQRLHAGVKKKALLLFQLDLDADAIEYLQLDADRDY